MANVLKIKREFNGNFSVFAKEDIDVGQTVLVEKAFFTYLHNRFGVKCNICLKGNCNLMPCKRCNVAMFCSDECQGNCLHAYECGLKVSDAFRKQKIMTLEVARVRPVRKGEKLFISYFSFLTKPTPIRQQIMFVERQTFCGCTRCKGVIVMDTTASQTLKQLLSSDPNYKYIISHETDYQATESTILDEKCVTFLRKYGQVPWCFEIGTVIYVYIERLKLRLNGSV